jgi:hypothetical protein
MSTPFDSKVAPSADVMLRKVGDSRSPGSEDREISGLDVATRKW